MAFIVIGVLLLLAKLGDFGPVATLAWPWVLSPFGLALAWWGFSDMTGRTSKKAMDRLDERKEKRRVEAMEKLGIDARKRK